MAAVSSPLDTVALAACEPAMHEVLQDEGWLHARLQPTSGEGLSSRRKRRLSLHWDRALTGSENV